MYPAAELNRLSRRKFVLRQRIAINRIECVTYAGEIAKPLEWIDRLRERWRRIGPLTKLAAIPLGLLFRRQWVRRRQRGTTLSLAWRWLPVVLSAFRMLKARRRVQASSLR